MSRISRAVWLGLAIGAMVLLIPGSGAALTLPASSSLTLSSAGLNTLHGSSFPLSEYSLLKSPLLSQGYTTALINSGTGFTTPFTTQTGTGTTLSTGSSSQLSGLFSGAMANYYKNPPKPISNPSPSGFLTTALGSDESWDAIFNPPPVYYVCGCG
ncbi:MAG TPA: hypothetical protein VMS89_03050 [Methanoregulaceae archaeon]|nr:hypothetical protein [Methanoregulaceae archaeon]